MKTRNFVILYWTIVGGFFFAVLFQQDPTAKSDALIWLAWGGLVFAIGIVIFVIKKKRPWS